MRLPLRLLVAAALVLAAPALAAAATAAPAAPATPTGLHGFLLRADEPVTHVFSRTPAFSWKPVPGADRYELELATSSSFADGTIVWTDATIRAPAASVSSALPWQTGSPYALYTHVRAWSGGGPGAWSQTFGFNLAPARIPSSLATYPGLLSWSTVPGATSYDVWLTDAKKVISTRSNVADEREYYDFHRQPGWTGLVHWRVRAVRSLYGSAPGLPPLSRGPWSKLFTSANPAVSAGALKLTAAFSDVTSSAAQPETHRLTPGFAFTGDTGLNGKAYQLFRVYVFSDSSCGTAVFSGTIIGSPAYAPRTSGPVRLPRTAAELDHAHTSYLRDGGEPASYTADALQVLPAEMGTSSTSPPTDTASLTPAQPGSIPGPPASIGGSGLPLPAQLPGAPVDLWDNGDGARYYWTVVPVQLVAAAPAGAPLTYRDAELPRSACAAGRVASFSKADGPLVAGATLPYASGLSPAGRLISAVSERPSFYGAPLVAWQPAVGADEYQLQWSRSQSPWLVSGETFTFATASELDATVRGRRVALDPGVWYYRVRGFNFALPGGAHALSWSEPEAIILSAPIFRIVPTRAGAPAK